jgi:hypothetical protein
MVSFEEVQRAPRSVKILGLVVLGIPFVIMSSIALYVSFSTDQPFNWKTALTYPGLLTFITLHVVMVTSRLRLRIDQHGVAIRFRPFHIQDKVILPSEIVPWRVRPLNAFWEFGGWGIRWGWKKKWGYV